MYYWRDSFGPIGEHPDEEYAVHAAQIAANVNRKPVVIRHDTNAKYLRTVNPQ
jgi:hypothetical protein